MLGSPAIAYNRSWFHAFMRDAGTDVDFITMHVYNRLSAFSVTELVRHMCTKYDKPVWLTELALGEPAKSDETTLQYMAELLPRLDDLSCLHRYAWYDPSDAQAADHNVSLQYDDLILDNGTVTPLGEFYARYVTPSFPTVPPFPTVLVGVRDFFHMYSTRQESPPDAAPFMNATEAMAARGGARKNDLTMNVTDESGAYLSLSIGHGASRLGRDGCGFSTAFYTSVYGMDDRTFGSRYDAGGYSPYSLKWKFGNTAEQREGDFRICNLHPKHAARLDSIHFDARNVFKQNQPAALELQYLSEGTALKQGVSAANGTDVDDLLLLGRWVWSQAEVQEVDIELASVLPRAGNASHNTAWLEAQACASFRFRWSGSAGTGGGNGQTQIDNLAAVAYFQALAVPPHAPPPTPHAPPTPPHAPPPADARI